MRARSDEQRRGHAEDVLGELEMRATSPIRRRGLRHARRNAREAALTSCRRRSVDRNERPQRVSVARAAGASRRHLASWQPLP